MADTDRVIVWERWRAGSSISDIARLVNRPPGSIFSVLRDRGGFSPPVRRRALAHLSFGEREEISRGLAAGDSARQIAVRLGRSPSTISRELARNGGPGKYRAVRANERAWKRGQRPKVTKLASDPALNAFVIDRLGQYWSPQQIAGYLKHQPKHGLTPISHESIYRSILDRSRGELSHTLSRHLRTRRALRRGRRSTNHRGVRGGIINAISIDSRPDHIEARNEIGHWEGDLVIGAKGTQIATLVERATRFTIITAVPNRAAPTVATALVKVFSKLNPELVKTVTFDRGPEFAAHATLTTATGIKVYFCHPYSPWQRGTNENTNGLIRQYFPKGTPIAVDPDLINQITQQLNTRPRRTLDYKSPTQTLATALMH